MLLCSMYIYIYIYIYINIYTQVCELYGLVACTRPQTYWSRSDKFLERLKTVVSHVRGGDQRVKGKGLRGENRDYVVRRAHLHISRKQQLKKSLPNSPLRIFPSDVPLPNFIFRISLPNFIFRISLPNLPFRFSPFRI
jgi:hypothetical protein